MGKYILVKFNVNKTTKSKIVKYEFSNIISPQCIDFYKQLEMRIPL